jgi:hypothetical protein
LRGLKFDYVPEDNKIAAMADETLVSVGFDGTTESEGMDRTFALP